MNDLSSPILKQLEAEVKELNHLLETVAEDPKKLNEVCAAIGLAEKMRGKNV